MGREDDRKGQEVRPHMIPLRGLGEDEIAILLTQELCDAADVEFCFDALTACRIGALLQLAGKHPSVDPRSRELIDAVMDRIRKIGPITAAILDREADDR
jgi:hypothetical protein